MCPRHYIQCYVISIHLQPHTSVSSVVKGIIWIFFNFLNIGRKRWLINPFVTDVAEDLNLVIKPLFGRQISTKDSQNWKAASRPHWEQFWRWIRQNQENIFFEILIQRLQNDWKMLKKYSSLIIVESGSSTKNDRLEITIKIPCLKGLTPPIETGDCCDNIHDLAAKKTVTRKHVFKILKRTQHNS